MDRFPVGGPREPVYQFLRYHGFQQLPGNDKHWRHTDGRNLHLYGAGSMARVYAKDGSLHADCELERAVMP